MELEYSRTLPPELYAEIHKCLPLPNAIHVLANVSKTFLNNKNRMLRNVQRIQRLKTSLNEYIGTLVDDGEDREELWITDDLQWKPEIDALFRYGTWLTTTRKFEMGSENIIEGTPKNFVEKLLLHMAYSCSAHMMLERVETAFEEAAIPIPTFMKPLLNNKKEHYQIGSRTLFESIQLETDNGQILHIFDAELKQYEDQLQLFVMIKTDGNNWFRIFFDIDSSKEFIWVFTFSKWNMQSFDVANFVTFGSNTDQIELNGNKLEAKSNIFSEQNLDKILRRGAGFTQFRHFKIKEPYYLRNHPSDYVDFLISSISITKHPEDFLESIQMNLDYYCSSSLIEKFWTIFHKGIPEVLIGIGISINLDNIELHILSAKIRDNKSEFILANIPTNGAYVFDVEVQFGKEGPKQISGIKIQKRKIDDGIVELKCDDQIGLGKKTKAENDNDDENGPTRSGKIMKQ